MVRFINHDPTTTLQAKINIIIDLNRPPSSVNIRETLPLPPFPAFAYFQSTPSRITHPPPGNAHGRFPFVIHRWPRKLRDKQPGIITCPRIPPTPDPILRSKRHVGGSEPVQKPPTMDRSTPPDRPTSLTVQFPLPHDSNSVARIQGSERERKKEERSSRKQRRRRGGETLEPTG